jgi:cobalt transporter subunit CbtA
MLVRVLLAAIAAGLLGGVFATAAQAVRVTPLIIAAESYENKTAPETSGHVHDHGATVVDGHSHDADTWAPADGWERTLFTLMSNMVVGVGFALLVTAAILVTNQSIDFRTGLLWGLGGFVTFVLAPNLGLPPELPGTASGDLDARQLWWLAAVVCTGAGLSIFAFKRHIAWMIAGLALIAAPHVMGAPQADVHESLAPASLAVQFVVASIATAFVYWLFLGGVLGFLLSKAIARERGHPA